MPKANIRKSRGVSQSESSGWFQLLQKGGFLFCIAVFRCHAIDAKHRTTLFSTPHHHPLKMWHWVVLGGEEALLFTQNGVPQVEKRLIGRKSPPFPVHVQCSSLNHARSVALIQEELTRLRARNPSPRALASTFYRSPHLPAAATDTLPWFAILNGISFKGILCSEEDKDSQLDNYKWASYCCTLNLRDALIHIILGGDKDAFSEITAASLTLPMDRLTLTALSYHASENRGQGRTYLNLSGNGAHSCISTRSATSSSTSSPSTLKSYHVPERGRSMTTNRANHSQLLPGKQQSSPPRVYKYIWGVAGVVGSITDPTGVNAIDFTDTENVVGEMCAKYLEAHGYGADVIRIIVDAYQATANVEDFVSRASGCGMSVVELEWFWEFNWFF